LPSALAWHEEIIDNREDEQCQQKPVEYRFLFALEKLVCVHFALSPSAFVEPASTMPKLITRLRIAAALRFSRTAIEPEVSPVAARTRS
jgi:hypothetical protein